MKKKSSKSSYNQVAFHKSCKPNNEVITPAKPTSPSVKCKISKEFNAIKVSNKSQINFLLA